ncbi:hypothetical protein KKE34_00585 [Patescibacteria group bacterium]|nr:hypothetical protein [Patescibacteria group bacterium]MBU1885087.1 hypothetical protein [Patescibacteria group bacterium]
MEKQINNIFEIELCENVRAVINTEDIHKIKQNKKSFKITTKIISDFPSKNKVIKQRFEENKNLVPIENGVSLINSEIVVVDPKSYIHPNEK